jgi:hypothetical protein
MNLQQKGRVKHGHTPPPLPSPIKGEGIPGKMGELIFSARRGHRCVLTKRVRVNSGNMEEVFSGSFEELPGNHLD